MELHNAEASLLQLAPCDLSSLSCQGEGRALSSLHRLRDLTVLTRLELGDYSFNGNSVGEVKWLKSLALQALRQLRVIDIKESSHGFEFFNAFSPFLEVAVQLPMATLETLHVLHSSRHFLEGDYVFSAQAKYESRLREVMLKILSLPRLREISGAGIFVDVAMEMGLRYWPAPARTLENFVERF